MCPPRPCDTGAVAPAAIIAAARAYLGVPFRHQGRSRTGLDCLGLGVVAFRDAGLAVEDAQAYRRQPDLRRLVAELDRQMIRLPRDGDPRPGVVALFRDQAWLHTGILTAAARFIHARGPEGIGPGVVEHGLDAQSWRPRLFGLWRHPGMAWSEEL
jgi:cell wall-associated NlpC family hydrolase